MNILHISDIHFGPYHWRGDDAALLERLNAYPADIVLNTGDLTSDSLDVEFQQVSHFLAQIKCPNIVSIIGNHDKYSKRSHEMFRQYIYGGPFVEPKDPNRVKKTKVFIDPATASLEHYFTEVNYLRQFTINGEVLLVVCVDTAVLQSDLGYIDEQILAALADEIANVDFDRVMLLTHHPILFTDGDPLKNPKRLSDFVLEQKIDSVFCGHTHEVDIVQVADRIRGRHYRQFMCGSLSSINLPRESNMFCTYDNFGTPEEKIIITRMHMTANGLDFEEMTIGV